MNQYTTPEAIALATRIGDACVTSDLLKINTDAYDALDDGRITDAEHRQLGTDWCIRAGELGVPAFKGWRRLEQ